MTSGDQNYETVQYKKEGHVATILMDLPDTLNAYNTGMRTELLQAFTQAGDDADVRVVIYGSTSKAFSSGADLTEGTATHDTVEELILEEYAPVIKKIGDLDKPVIAAVGGAMAGVAGAFVLNCDLVVMSENAYLYLAFTNIGLIPDGGISWHLYHHLGYQRAFQLLAEGGKLKAQDCFTMGLANKLVPENEVNSVCAQWADNLAQKAPIALREAKRALRVASTSDLTQTIATEAKSQNRCLNSEDAKEGITAFLEKRKPEFIGQ